MKEPDGQGQSRQAGAAGSAGAGEDVEGKAGAGSEAIPILPASGEPTQRLGTDFENSQLDHEVFVKRLHSVPRPTRELELLISGAVVFSLFQMPGRLRGWFETIEPHVGKDIGMLPFMVFYCLTLVAISLAVAFSLHFVLRSVWVGLTGLRSVFPKGIEWEQLDLGPISKTVAREMNPNLRSAEERVDRVASSIFSVLFAFVVGMVVAFAFLLLPTFIVELVRSRYFPQTPSLVTANVVVGRLALPLLSVALFDSWFKKDPSRVDRHPKLFKRVLRLSRVQQRVFLAGLTSPVVLTLSSRWSVKKVSVGVGVGMAFSVVFFVGYFVTTLGIIGFDSYVFFPLRGGSTVLNSEHYEDQRSAGEGGSALPTLPSEVIDGPFARVFIPFHVGRDADRVREACPDLQPVRSEGFFLHGRARPDDDLNNVELLKCVVGTYVVRIDKRPAKGDWAFWRHPVSGLQGLVGYLWINGLDPGPHVLDVARHPAKGEETFLLSWDPHSTVESELVEDSELLTKSPLQKAGLESVARNEPRATTEVPPATTRVAFKDRSSILFWTTAASR